MERTRRAVHPAIEAGGAGMMTARKHGMSKGVGKSAKPSSLITHPSSLKSARILVVGDAMLDRYWFGEVERISPEAPVPIVKIDHEEERAGGAANVARNAAALGAQV